MKRNNCGFGLKCALGAASVVGLSLLATHLCNKRVFSRAKSKNPHNGVWKCKYGEIAFTKKGAGEPILLLHSAQIGAGGFEWGKTVEGLTSERTVYTVDLPGFGYSEKRDFPYNSYYYAVFINEFIKKVIGRKTEAVAIDASCGFLLGAVKLSKELFSRVTVINPYNTGQGSQYDASSFVGRMLPLPIIGTFVYNFIASKQSVLSQLDKVTPVEGNFDDARELMEKFYLSAHANGAKSKNIVISMSRRYFDAPIFKLMQSCPVPIDVVISNNSPIPLLAEGENLRIIELNDCGGRPNLCASDFGRWGAGK